MMIFQADMAFALGLIALTLGGFLFQQATKGVAKIISYVVLVGSVLTLLCVSYNTYKVSKSGGNNMPMRPPMMMGPRTPGMLPPTMPGPKTNSPAMPPATNSKP